MDQGPDKTHLINWLGYRNLAGYVEKSDEVPLPLSLPLLRPSFS